MIVGEKLKSHSSRILKSQVRSDLENGPFNSDG